MEIQLKNYEILEKQITIIRTGQQSKDTTEEHWLCIENTIEPADVKKESTKFHKMN